MRGLSRRHGVLRRMVRACVARLRRELESGRVAVTVPQLHPPGAEAEVDFGRVSVWLDGELTELSMFVMRLSHSGRAVHVCFPSEARRRSRKATCPPSGASAGCPGGCATTTSRRLWCACWPGASESRATASPRCARTSASTRSTARPGLEGAKAPARFSLTASEDATGEDAASDGEESMLDEDSNGFQDTGTGGFAHSGGVSAGLIGLLFAVAAAAVAGLGLRRVRRRA